MVSNIDNIIQLLQQSKDASFLSAYYGSSPDVLSKRTEMLLRSLTAFKQAFPHESNVAVIRVPGRVNLMGVHIDHRGGSCNHICIDRETVFCFSPRHDGRIVVHNASNEFPPGEFLISDLVPESSPDDWLQYLDAVSIEKGNWLNYIQAGAARLQVGAAKVFEHGAGASMNGMNCLVCGDIPPKSGLSSSSTLVVGAVLALCKINQIELPSQELIELCGEAEWYIGTRGGCGDHAAMALGKLGQVTHVGFQPIAWEHYPLHEEISIVLCQSGIEANKATHARATFNSRIAAYEIALRLYRHHHPDLADKIQCFRDIQPDQDFLNISFIDFYNRLKAIPVEISADQLLQTYPEYCETWDQIFHTYGKPSEPLPIREVALFGIGECSRSKRFAEYCKNENYDEAGKLMFVSHDGDRISVWAGEEKQPYRSPYSDAFIDQLAAELMDQLTYNLSIENTGEYSVAYQPGGYRCSVEEMDRMVDRCKEIDGVLGAGLTGAGLGGAIVVLCKKDATPALIQKMTALMEGWTACAPFIEACHPVQGAGRIEFPNA